MKSFLPSALAIGLLLTIAPAGADPPKAAPHPPPAPMHAPAVPMHYVHPPVAHPMPIVRQPLPRSAPDQFHPVTQPVREYTPHTTRNVRIDNPQVFKDITAYHANRYHTTVNVNYAAHPGYDHGYWNNGWYHGYWHDYWANQEWTNWSGHYGFWLNLDGLNTFVYEYSPGVCWYYNGFEWLPWYNAPYTPYQCPY
jgi:hypothetical protein